MDQTLPYPAAAYAQESLPSLADLGRERLSVSALANRIYPRMTWDYALPQDWVDRCLAPGDGTLPFDPRGQIVWLYPRGFMIGTPAPLTQEAAAVLSDHLKRLG